MLGWGDRTFNVLGGIGLICLGYAVATLIPEPAYGLVPLALGTGGGFALGGAVIDYVRKLG